MSKFLFLVASSREPGQLGNTEWLARQAAGTLDQEDEQRLSLAIAMVLAAGVHRTNIRSALRMAKELH